MRHLLLALLFCTSSLWAAEPRELTWSELIPPDAPPQWCKGALRPGSEL